MTAQEVISIFQEEFEKKGQKESVAAWNAVVLWCKAGVEGRKKFEKMTEKELRKVASR